MIFKKIKIGNIPAVIYGKKSEKVYLFVHGKCGNKEEAEGFAEIVCPKGFQVLSIDLPQHGERIEEKDTFYPWVAVPEIENIYIYIKTVWTSYSLRANSIGAWYSMLAAKNIKLDNVLLVSPIVNMNRLICDMMMWANVTKERLEKEQIINTDFGETLSWKYYRYSIDNKINKWDFPTSVLYAGNDNLTSREKINDFIDKFNCHLTVMENGEHWFHTPEQLEVLNRWTNENT